MNGIERRAQIFAKRAHESIDQRRKYTGAAYFVHPTAVALLVKSVKHTPEMIAAAYLHDVIEDVPSVSSEDIHREFGLAIGSLVDWLTDVSRPSDGPREVRKAIDRAHTAAAPPAAKTIKLADLIDNTSTIKLHDPDFWMVYRREKLLLLEVLTEGDRLLWEMAAAQCR